jgi:DNA-binding transcriptional ArsR family regulator
MNIQGLTEKSEEAAGMLAMLANPCRLRIMCELHKSERSVSEIEAVIGLSQSALSQHLAKLRGAGLVKTRREAQTIYYSVQDARVARLLAVLFELYCVNERAADGAAKRRKR